MSSFFKLLNIIIIISLVYLHRLDLLAAYIGGMYVVYMIGFYDKT